MSMKIEYKEKDVDFVAELDNRICLLCLSSGEGKTFLFRTLNTAICEPWHSRYYYYDYTTMDKILNDMNVYLNPNNIVIFDNADLYRDDILTAVKNSKSSFVIITKSLYWLSTYMNELEYYHIEHAHNYVRMMKDK